MLPSSAGGSDLAASTAQGNPRFRPRATAAAERPVAELGASRRGRLAAERPSRPSNPFKLPPSGRTKDLTGLRGLSPLRVLGPPPDHGLKESCWELGVRRVPATCLHRA